MSEGLRSKHTAACYKRCFEFFLNHIKIHDLQVLLDFSPKVIKQMIIDYILYLRDVRKISRGSINVHLTAILHFFTINNDDFTLTTRNFKLHLPYDDYESDNRSYTVEEIAQVIGSCDLRSKMMILLTASTGMRIGALHSLQISDLCKVEYDNSIVYRINVYARTHSHYYTYCTPECAEAIDEYKKYRQRYGEKLTDKSPLIREQFNVNM